MSMSLKQELETWAAALKAYDEEDFEKALNMFGMISESSKIQVNIGLIYATVGSHEEAVEHFHNATQYDQYLAVAYFQCGVSNFLLNRYEEAYKDFDDSLLYLRGNQAIFYDQLGLKFNLHTAEVLFNKGLCLVYLGRPEDGVRVMQDASKEKSIDEHNVIDEAIRDRGDGYTVFSIPIGVLYRPSEVKLKNAKTKDYMGKAKLVAAADSRDAYTTFVGSTRLAQGMTPTGAPLPAERAANLGRSQTMQPPRMERDDPFQPRLPGTGLAKASTVAASNPSNGEGGTKPLAPVRGLTIRRDGSGIARGGTLKVAAPKIDTSIPMFPLQQNAPLTPESQGRTPPQEDVVFTGNGSKVSPDDNDNRVTAFYDDYLTSYDNERDMPPVPPLPPVPMSKSQQGANAKLADWVRSGAGVGAPPPPPPPPLSRMASSYANSYMSENMPARSGTVRRKVTRRATTKGDRYVPASYDDEEGSEDFEEVFELVKIRVKLHYNDEVRGMAITPDVPFGEFMDKVTRKFNQAFDGLGMEFKDEDGTRISLRDESDYDLAIETAREAAKGRPEGKLEVWCEEL